MQDAVFEIDRGLEAVLQAGGRYDPDRRYVDSGGTRRGKLSLTHEIIVHDLLKGVKFSRKNWVFASQYDHQRDCYDIYFTGPDTAHCHEGAMCLPLMLGDLAAIPSNSKILERENLAPGQITLGQINKIVEEVKQLAPAIGTSAFDPHVATWVGSPQISGGYPSSGQFVGGGGTTSSLGVPSPGSVATLGGTSFTVNAMAPANCNEGTLYFDQGDQNFRRMINGSWTVLKKNDKLVAELLGMD